MLLEQGQLCNDGARLTDDQFPVRDELVREAQVTSSAHEAQAATLYVCNTNHIIHH